MPVATMTQPKSLSIYRGQSRIGEGEGPGRPILHGEQYMRVAPELYEGELLDAIRPWMTLDSDPADHQRLDDKLEGWSLFSVADSLFVVRLISAGIYDRRAAYFAHARRWKRRTLPYGFDPGLHLGRSDAFAAPWRDSAPAETEEYVPVVVRPEQLAAEGETATLFLGHLLQAVAGAYPLLIAAPISDFAAGSPLHALVSFARGGLPAAARRECRVRIYSRSPELFLRHLGANLLVVPEEVAGAALAARSTATLLDRRGQKLAGRDLDRAARDYAAAVVDRTTAIPEGLPFFGARCDLAQRLPTADDVRTVQVAYNIGFALAGTSERRVELLAKYLPRAAARLGPGLPWHRLIPDEDWSAFPPDALADQLLADADDVSSGRQELRRAIEDAASRLALRVDSRLAQWWDANDPGKLRLLIALLTRAPALVSDKAAAERTRGVPLRQLEKTGALERLLEAEANSGLLAARDREAHDLASCAAAPNILALLSKAVSRGELTTQWASEYIAAASDAELVNAARQWLPDARFWTGWGDIPKRLLARLAAQPQLTIEVGTALRAAADLSHVADVELLLQLAEVLARVDDQANATNRFIDMLIEALPRFSGPPSRNTIETALSDSHLRALSPERLTLSAVAKLLDFCHDDASHDRLYEDIDRRMRADADAPTEMLVRTGWWFFWRGRSGLDPRVRADVAALRNSATAWMTSRAWDEGIEPTREAWHLAVADLPQTLSGADVAQLRMRRAGLAPWPWLAPFEEEQCAEFIKRAGDLGAVAELAVVVRANPRVIVTDAPERYVVERSRFSTTAPEAIAWLIGEATSVLSLAASAALCNAAGHRSDQALAARVRSVIAHLDVNPMEAVKAASAPSLWQHGSFLSALASWMNRRGSLASVGNDVAKWIDQKRVGKPDAPLASPSPSLLSELNAKRLHNAARLLQPALSSAFVRDPLLTQVLDALLQNEDSNACWPKLAKRLADVRFTKAERGARDPLIELAEHIRDEAALSANERKTLALHGWSVFERATERHSTLLEPSSSPVDGFPAFDLTASMLGTGTIGRAALRIVHAAVARPRLNDDLWWQRLFSAIREFKRHGKSRCADDRADIAVALLAATVRDFESDAQHAFSSALRKQPHNDPSITGTWS